MQKFEFLRQPLLGELAMSRKRERVATYVYASSQGQRTHSARTNLRFYILLLCYYYVSGIFTQTKLIMTL